MAWKHYINGIQTYPSEGLDIEGDFEEEYYQFSIKINGLVIGKNTDASMYNYLMNIENGSNRCQSLTYHIYNDSTLIYNGTFKMNDCFFNPAECEIEIDLSEGSTEKCIRDRWAFEQNLLERPIETIYADSDDFAIFVYTGAAYDGLNRRTVADGAPTASDYVTAGADPAEQSYIQVDFIDGPYTEDGDDWNYYVAYHYRRTILQTTGGCSATLDGYDLLTTTSTGGNTFCVYIKQPQPGDLTGAGNAVVSSTIPSAQPWNLITASPAPLQPNKSWYIDRISSYQNTRARDFLDIIENLFLPDLCASITTIDSDFFTASINPITGETNYFNNLKVIQLSDFLLPNATQPATRGLISFQKLMMALNAMFDVFWFTDGNSLRIEHRSYFLNLGSGIDVTAQSQANPSYSYEGELPSSEKFIYPISESTDFIDHNIQYIDSNGDINGCVNDQNEDITVNDFSTDVSYLVTSPTVGNKGFVLVACDSDNNVIKLSSATNGYQYLNYPLSWRYLISKLHKENRSALEGDVNGIQTSFNSIKLVKKLADVEVPMCPEDYANFDPFLKATTIYGNATIKKFTYERNNKFLILELWQ